KEHDRGIVGEAKAEVERSGSQKALRVISIVHSAIRRYMEDHGYYEVETPILHPILGGANAFRVGERGDGHAAIRGRAASGRQRGQQGRVRGGHGG
ncbi:amino acid--tRNA ligase-related protein, partial [Eggerthella lenta]|uniref:amino acid--tRNA ligase-related protein n=1 Tax=Eggerthella lenta TaxID=84112 RepID=UPI00272FB0FD